jgi:hypothetical protein
LVVLCAGSTLPLTKQSLDEAPYKLSGAVAKLAGITFWSIDFFLDLINLGFFFREKLAAVLIIPSSWEAVLLLRTIYFAVNLLSTILRPCSAARCIYSIGSPGLGRVVYRYVCAATSAASSIFGMMFPCSSTDRKDESRFLERLCLSECSRFSNLDPCRRCLLLFVYDASLRAL